ncbi:MAG: Rieske 2Fe-2S domain-containing protein [Chloroflexi bacterium]|nr:Rieske 2Fe-2S domain-containing protein [Chloroflexota bacterium]
MLSVEDNELITRTGPGTLMGNFMRQYWVPCMLSSELPNPDSDPVRVLILGEKMIAFRDTNGQVGLIQNHCPHRGASLFFGRNEEAGLRCVYHGWKFDVTGQCIDMPNEPADSNFKNKVKATAYPCVERGGLVWTYMGPRSAPPPLPDIEGNALEGSVATATMHECNYLQVGEGAIDTSHAGLLHFGSLKAEDQPENTFSQWLLTDRAPRYAVVDIEAGVTYGAYRDAMPGHEFWRIANFLLPFYTMNPQGQLGAGPGGWQARVPMDDEHMISFGMGGPRRQRANPDGSPPRQFAPQTLPNGTGWYDRFRPIANFRNDYEIDRDLQRRNDGPNGWTGIAGINRQDMAVTDSMGPIYDRSREHLGTSDSMIIRTRRRLLNAAKAFAETGVTPPGVDNPEHYHVRSGSVVLPKGVDWWEATKDLRAAYVDHPELDRSLMAGGLSG